MASIPEPVKACIEECENLIDNGNQKFLEIYALFEYGKISNDEFQTLIDDRDFFPYNENKDDIASFHENPVNMFYMMREFKDESISNHIRRLKDEQTKSGRYMADPHTGGFIRLINQYEGNQEAVQDAVNYFRNNKMKDTEYVFELKNILLGALGLSECNYDKYQIDIEECSNIISNRKELLLETLERDEEEILIHSVTLLLTADLFVRTGKFEELNYLANELTSILSNQNPRIRDPGALAIFFKKTEYGPKKPASRLNWINKLQNQRKRINSSEFLVTSPNDAVAKYDERIKSLIDRADEEILLTSLRIDMHYDRLIEKYGEDVDIKLVTRSTQEISGSRKRIAKGAVQRLKENLQGGIKSNPLLHSRMIIIDEEVAVVGSADFSRDQLKDEFNAAVLTQDKNVVDEATNLFYEIWDNSEHID